jgi:hypothetical protein
MTGPLIADAWFIHRALCHVPGCSWLYDAAVVTDAQEQAIRHRREHRDAVPATSIRHDTEYDVYCEPCGGHRRTFGTRTDAQAWLNYHLSAEHGLVSCP